MGSKIDDLSVWLSKVEQVLDEHEEALAKAAPLHRHFDSRHLRSKRS